MVEGPNGRISEGVFHARTGNYTIPLPIFIDIMGLGHSVATWRNKLTMYFRLKSLYSYGEHIGGVSFRSTQHQTAWDIVSCWVKDGDKLLPENCWITTKYGNTELRVLVREMVQEVHHGKCHTPSVSLLVRSVPS